MFLILVLLEHKINSVALLFFFVQLKVHVYYHITASFARKYKCCCCTSSSTGGGYYIIYMAFL